MSANSKRKIIALLLASNMVMSATSGLLTVTASATTDTQVSATNVATKDIVEDGQIIDTQTSNFTNMGAEGYSFTINDSGVITGFTHNNTSVTDIVIPAEINGKKVTGIGDELFKSNSTITSVTIPEGVTSIGNNVFIKCTALKSVTIPKGVTSIGRGAFYDCSSLTTVIIPEGVKSIGDYAFSGCSNLTSVTIQEGVTSIGNSVFRRCSKLTSVTIPEGVTSIGVYAFHACTDLTSVTLPSTLTSIGNHAFGECSSLTSVTIPKGVTSIGNNVFYNCTALKSVTIPEGVTSISRAAFYKCSSLADVYYNGKEEQWNNISIAESNDPLKNATKHFKAYDFDIDKDTGVITGFDHIAENITEIIIPSEISGIQVTGIGEYSISNDCITSVTISEGITSIGEGAFWGCTSLISVTLPSTLTSIGSYTFVECTNLTSITIPEGVTSIGESVFQTCSGLTSITLPSSVTSIDYGAFYNCTSLTDVYYNGTKSQWEQIEIDNSDDTNQLLLNATKHFKADYEFTVDANGVITGFTHNKITVTDIVIPAEIGGKKVTGIGEELFLDNKTIKSVTIPEGVTSIGKGAFVNCSSLTSVTIPSTVTSIGDYTFYKCSSLTSVTIPSTVTSIGKYAFNNCTALTSVTIPEGVTSIGNNVFYNCTNLTSVTIPSTVTVIGYRAFYGCTSLKDVYYNGTESQWNNISIAESNDPLKNATKHFKVAYEFTVDSNGVIIKFTHNDTTVTDIVIPSTVNGTKVTGIGEELFYHNKDITSVTIPEGVTSIGGFAFEGCDSLEKVTIPSTVKSIGIYVFFACSSLKDIYYNGTKSQWDKINIANFNETLTNTNKNFKADYEFTVDANGVITKFTHNNTAVTDIVIPSEINGKKVTGIGDNLFYYYRNITSVTIPEGVKSIGKYAFYYCTSLKSVTIPEGVTSIGENAFYGCVGLKNAALPSTLTSIGGFAFYYCLSLTTVTIPEGVTSIGEYAFHECSSLTSVTIPSTVKTIGDYTFYGCSKLTSITLPNAVTTIGLGVFYNCSELKNVTLPSNLTSIDSYAFYGCSKLTSITLPITVTEIGYGTFGKCTNLTDVYYNGVESQWNKISIPGENDQLKNATKHFKTYDFEINEDTGVITKFTHLDKTDTDIVIPSEINGTKVTGIGMNVFLNNEDITTVTIPEGVTSIGESSFCWCTSLQSITIPEGVTSISNAAFVGCSALTSITFPSTLTSIGNTVFYSCSKLTDVYYNGTASQWNKISIGNEENEPLTNATKHFKAYDFEIDANGVITKFTYDNTNVTDIVIPAEINGIKVTGLGNNLFKDNKTITSVTIPEGVKSIEKFAFDGCTSLTSVTIPEGVTSIGEYAFYGCSSLESVTIPEGVTSISDAAFVGCSNLKSITIPSSVTSIGGSTFAYCSSLTSVTIPESVISIGATAFYGCSSLSDVTIPSTLTTIDVGVFYDCPRLTDVYYNGTQEQWKKVQIDNTDDYNQLLHDVTKHYNKCAFVGANLTLQNNISVNYYVDKLAFDKFGYTDLSATFTLNDRITVVDKYTTSADGKYYVFTFSGVSPQMMGDTITTTLSATYNGEKVTSEVKEYSILEYCNNKLEKSDIKAELKTLIVDLLNYGSMAQKGVNHNTDKLVNAGLTADEQQAFVNWATTNTYTSARNIATNVAEPILTWTGASLNLNDSIDINVYFTMANADVKSIVVKDANDKTVDTITEFVDVDNNEKMAKFNKLIVSQLSDIYTFTAYDNNGEVVSNTLTYSVESYAYAKQNSTNKDLVNLINAMMKYGESAKAYAETL